MPFEASWRNKLELSNEALMLFSTYFLFLYSDGFIVMEAVSQIIKDNETQEEVGWAHIALLLVTIVLNLTVMLTVQVYEIFCKVKLIFLKRRQKKIIEEVRKRKLLKMFMQ